MWKIPPSPMSWYPASPGLTTAACKIMTIPPPLPSVNLFVHHTYEKRTVLTVFAVEIVPISMRRCKDLFIYIFQVCWGFQAQQSPFGLKSASNVPRYFHDFSFVSARLSRHFRLKPGVGPGTSCSSSIRHISLVSPLREIGFLQGQF